MDGRRANANDRVDRNVCVHSILAGSVDAADLPFKAPPPPPPVFSWTGFYAGLNVGGGIGVSSTAQNATFNSTVLGINGLLAGGTNSLAMTGWLLGAQAGFNWQVAPSIVLGIEGDWQWTSQQGSTVNSTPPAALAFFGAGANGFGYSLATQQKLTEIATARARRRRCPKLTLVCDRRRGLGHYQG